MEALFIYIYIYNGELARTSTKSNGRPVIPHKLQALGKTAYQG